MKYLKQLWLSVLASALCFSLPLAGRAQDAESSNNAQPTVQADSNQPAITQPSVSDDSIMHREDMVQIGRDSELRADEEARQVVTVFGSTTVDGHAQDNVVSVFGDVTLNGKADRDVVAVFGDIHVGSNAVINGDAVSVGGNVDRDPGAKIHGRIQETAFGAAGYPRLDWLGQWITNCLFKLRLLSLNVKWAWPIAFVIFLLYLLIAAAFPQAVRPCVETLNTRPMTSLAVGILGKFAYFVIVILLLCTVIGIFVIPFLQVALLVAFLVGKVAILERIGCGIGKASNNSALQRPVLGFVLGAAIITFIYTVPVLGLLTFLFISSWGSGAAVTAAYIHFRGERPPKAPAAKPQTPPPSSSAAPAPAAIFATAFAPFNTGDPAAAGGPAASAPSTEPGIPPLTPPVVPTALAYPRGGFWLRMAAGFLDCVLIMLVSVQSHGPMLFFIVALAYFSGMIAWRGTTVGGIILRLQVVRANGQPITFVVALVRALAAFFSGIILFLGFFWIGWDLEKQGWHDKIAGTVVVRLPHAPALVCI